MKKMHGETELLYKRGETEPAVEACMLSRMSIRQIWAEFGVVYCFLKEDWWRLQ